METEKELTDKEKIEMLKLEAQVIAEQRNQLMNQVTALQIQLRLEMNKNKSGVKIVK